MENKHLLESSDSEDDLHILYSQRMPQKKKKNSMIEFKQLCNIVQTGNLDKIRRILKEPNLQLSGAKGTSMLHMAAASNNKEVLGLLLTDSRFLALLNRQDNEGLTPLLAAMMTGSYETLELLCAWGADPCKTLSKNGNNVLHLAAIGNHSKAAEIVLKYNTSPELINAVNSHGNTPIIEAGHFHSLVFLLLLEAGADITVQNPHNGRTLLHIVTAYNMLDLLKKILQHPQATADFADIKDVKDDTALLIAVKLDRLEMVDLLLNTFDNLSGINYSDQDTVFHIAVRHNRVDILKLLVNSGCKSCIDYMDQRNRTPLLYAAELDRSSCLVELIENGGDYELRNPRTGETFIHVIAGNLSNSTLPYVINIPNVFWFFTLTDFQGNTPYMTAIANGNGDFLLEALKVKQIELCDENSEGEPPVYYTVKQGHLATMTALLMSPKYYYFVRNNENTNKLNDLEEVIKLEMRGDLYATDVFLLLGKVIKHPLLPWFPPGLLRKTRDNRNVFHACALGGNLGDLELLYEFFSVFGPEYLTEMFDGPDILGNTPVLFAAQCGVVSTSCVHFFITHGAEMSSINNAGLNFFKAILTYYPEVAESLITSLLDSCVTETKEHYYEDKTNIKFNFSILCPEGVNQMRVIYTLFNEFTNQDNRSATRRMIQHPVLETLMKYKYQKIKPFLGKYLILMLFMTNVVASVMPMIYIGEDPEKKYSFLTPFIYRTIHGMLIFLSFTLIVLKVPHLLTKHVWNIDIIAFAPFITTLTLVCVGRDFPLAPELTAITISSYYIYLMVYIAALYYTFSYQIAVFFQILRSIARHLTVFAIMIFAFSLTFLCIFHNEPRFSFFPTAFGYTLIVVISAQFSDLPIFIKDYFTSTPITFHFLIECLTITTFTFMIVIGFINMLVGLAVRSANVAELDGKILKQHLQARIMYLYDYWFDNKLYSWLLRKGFMLKTLKKIRDYSKIKLDIGIFDEALKPVICDSTISQCRSITLKKDRLRASCSNIDETSRGDNSLNYGWFQKTTETPTPKSLMLRQVMLEKQSSSTDEDS